MIKFTEGGLEDIWPKKTPRIQALSYAMKQAMKLIDEKYDAAAKSYRERYKELVSEDFWKKYLGID